MARNVSIEISARDNFSSAITTMRNSNQSFNKDLTGTMEKLDALNKNKVTLKVETDKARTALRDAEKQFTATGSAADKMAVEMAGANYDNAKRNLDLVSKNARQAEHDILNMTDAVSKADNRASKGGGSGSGSVLKGLAGAGLGQMVGQSLQGAANTYMTSLLGSEKGNAFGDILGGVASGAAIGSMIPGVGTAIGAAVGGGAGIITAATKTFANRDERFKSETETLYNNAMQSQDEALESGKTIAGTREQAQIAFSQKLGGDKAASEYLGKVKTMAKETNYDFDEITGYSKKLLNSYKPDQVLDVLQTLSDASAGLDLNDSDVNMFISGLSRMRTTGKATQEYLNYFSERGVDVYQALGDAVKVDKSKIAGMVTKGKISGDTAAQAILDFINKTYGGLSEKMAGTYDAMVDNLKDAQSDLYSSMGEGFEGERKSGIQAEMDWLGGSNGEKMKDAYSRIGAWKASLKNDEEAAVRSAMDKAMQTDDYKIADAAGNAAKTGEILARARADAEMEYQESDGYQQLLATQIKTIRNIRTDATLHQEYLENGKNWFEVTSEGYAAAQQRALQENPGLYSGGDGKSKITGETIQAGGHQGNAPQNGKSKITGETIQAGGYRRNADDPPLWIKWTQKAVGINRVPYNNYPALLHEGERVLTGVEARSQKGTGGVVVEINGPVSVRKESDIDDIASRLFDKIKTAALITP